MANNCPEHAVLLITPPFCQPNTPYPATPFLKGILNSQHISSFQVDLGIEVIDQLFSKNGFEQIFREILHSSRRLSASQKRMTGNMESYLSSIEPVMKFLRGTEPELAYRIVTRTWLPEGPRFRQITDLYRDFGRLGLQDQAKYLASLYLEDICDLITETIDPDFGFSRYAEKLGRYANTFDELESRLNDPEGNNLVIRTMLSILERVTDQSNPTVVAITVPFPGNLFTALKCGQWLKANHPGIRVALGGGFVSTELRNVTDRRVFNYVDQLSTDGNIDSLLPQPGAGHAEETREIIHAFPDYDGLYLEKYFSVLEMANPMHRLWSDGRWNKLMVAHGCYWAKCSFCDVSLSYIKDYEPFPVKNLCDRMEVIMEKTSRSGFHFTDEAAPPALLKKLAEEIIRRKLVVTWWTNIRFERHFNEELCRLLQRSGCIAVSGGLEVASPRILQMINKGVTLEQVIRVTSDLTKAGIMVHAYLMYGFPTQTAQETIDSLEVVRQMFKAGIIRSGFWHRFALTTHSPVGLDPERFGIRIRRPESVTFALNDLDFEDPRGCDHEKFSYGLRKSLYNFMHGIGLDYPVYQWFDFRVPATGIVANFVKEVIRNRKNDLPAIR